MPPIRWKKEKSPNPEKVAGLGEAIKRKRKETSEMVKRDLDEKLARRMKLMLSEIREKMLAEEKELDELQQSPDEKIITKIKSDMKEIVVAGTEGVNASTILNKKLKFDGKSTLLVEEKKYTLKKNVHIVGWGSECMMLASSLEKIIGKHTKKGMLVVPRGTIYGMWNYSSWFPRLDTCIQYFEAGYGGFPDRDSAEGAKKIADYCKKLKKKDILVVILTGGAEKLLCCPKPGLTLEDKLEFLKNLKAAGCGPALMDLCTKKLSFVKGGGLARLAYPAKVIVLNMINTSMNVFHEKMGSPVTNDVACTKPIESLQDYKFYDNLAPNLLKILEEDTSGANKKMAGEDGEFTFVQNCAISPEDAMDDMWNVAFTQGFTPLKIASNCFGFAEVMGREYANITSLFILAVSGKLRPCQFYEKLKDSPVFSLTAEKVDEVFPSRDNWRLGLYLLLGGKCKDNILPCTNVVNGGANQELALHFSLEWYMKCLNFPILKNYDVWFLGTSTSGKDGSTKISGAYGYGRLGANVYDKYNEICNQLKEAKKKVKLEDCSEPVIPPENEELIKKLEREEKKYKNILPHHVLKTHKISPFFEIANDGKERLNIGNALNYTHTDVGDLHIIRITRSQCKCDGTCSHKNSDTKETILPKKEKPKPPGREKTCKLAFCGKPLDCKNIINWRRQDFVNSFIT